MSIAQPDVRLLLSDQSLPIEPMIVPQAKKTYHIEETLHLNGENTLVVELLRTVSKDCSS